MDPSESQDNQDAEQRERELVEAARQQAIHSLPQGEAKESQSNQKQSESPKRPGTGRAINVRCPHCHQPIELVEDNFEQIDCPSCGSHFSLIPELTSTLNHATEHTIGHFRLTHRLGVGAFGEVWRAKDRQLDRTVAVKIPRKGQLDANETEQFLREARATAQLKHPSIVGVHEVGCEDGQIYIIRDFVEGVTLKDRLTAGPVSSHEAAELCAKVADALHHAHDAGVIHRDLKPSNVMLDDKNEPHVMDFGLAKREVGEITMTVAGQVLGTPAYMPPEQAQGEGHDADARSDVYSLGVILFELLTGERPFRGNTQMLLHQVIHEDPPSPRKLNANVPRDLETICLKCLEKDPVLRYPAAEELTEDLQRFLRREPILARPATRIERAWRWCRRNQTVSSSIAAMALVVLVAAIVIIDVRRDSFHLIVSAAARNDRKRAASLVDALLTAPADAVPYAITSLEPLRGIAVPILRKRFEDTADPVHRLRAAYALAEIGQQVELEFLAASIPDAAVGECSNIISAIRHSRDTFLEALQGITSRADSTIDRRLDTRLAIVVTHLGHTAMARERCKLAPDPIRRTLFIDTFRFWHGDVKELTELHELDDDSSLRSAMIIAVGSIPFVELTSEAKQAWRTVLVHWYQTAPDTGTHSAAVWALRKWEQERREAMPEWLPVNPVARTDTAEEWTFGKRNLELPEIAASKQPSENCNWHVNSVGMTMLKIPAGRFVRKDSGAGEDAIGQSVTLTRSFLLADREVSRAQFQQFIDDPNCPDAEKPIGWPGAHVEKSPTEQHPVQRVNWYDTVLFCNWLSRQEGLTACYERTAQKEKVKNREYDDWRLIAAANGYRLPTEAEWEYACRAGTVTMFSHGNDMSERYAVYRLSRTELPGSKRPNAWGLFDVHGNVWEWCHDRYEPFGSEGALSDPMGATRGYTLRVHRGGSFYYDGRTARSAHRSYNLPDYRGSDVGFRAARTFP